MATELEPCPFCGGVATHWYCTANGLYVTKFFGQMLRGHKAEHNLISCNRCGCRTKVYAHKSNAFKAWNRRVTIKVETSFYDKEETFPDCTVQVLTNTATGETSVGWWKNDS